MTDGPFDQRRVRRAFDRAADSYQQCAVLQREVADRLLQALDVVRLQPERVLDAGCGTGETWDRLRRRYPAAQVVAMDLSENMLSHTRRRGHILRRPDCVCGDLQRLPFVDGAFDLVFSSLAMQWCNDLGEVFAEVHRVLRPGGLFVFTSFGPDTLKELRAAWSQIDDDVHVNEFIDMHDIGDELVRCRFAEPVMHAEPLVMQYPGLELLLQDLRGIGANVTQRGHRRGLMTPALRQKLEDSYERMRDADGALPATWEVLYGHAWKAPSSGGRPPGEIEVRFRF